MTGCGYLGNPCRHSNALKTADTTAGTIPSSMKEGINQIIIGSTLRTQKKTFDTLERSKGKTA